MSYYGGDYYAGGYYAGGFFGNVFRGITGTIGGAVGGFLTKGLPGAIVGAAGGAFGATRRNITTATLESGGRASAYTPVMRAKHAAALVRGGSSSAPVRGAGTGGVGIMAPGGGLPGGGGMALMAPPMHGMRRLHWNRSTYVTRGGGTSRWPMGLAIHPKGTEPVPSRRMNVANPRALRRGLRRLRGFAKLARKVLVTARHFKKSGVSRGVRRVRK